MGRRAWLIAAAVDIIAVVLFAAVGRRSHDGTGIGAADDGIANVVVIAAPFLVALAAGWLLLPGGRARPRSISTGVGLWAVTVVGGLVLRRTVWDRGVAVSFVIVASLALGVLLVGWRGSSSFARGRHGVPSSPPPSKAGL